MPGYFARNCCDVLGPEHLVDAAMALPEDHAAARGLLSGVLPPSASACGSQTGICVQRDAHAAGPCCGPGAGRGRTARGCVRAKAQSSTARGVGRRADDAAVPAAERLQAGGRVDVGDRHQVVGVDHLAQLLPAVFDLLDLGHVGHRAAGGQVGQDRRARARRRARPAARAGWPGCRPSRP